MSFFECRNLKYSYGKKEVLGGVTFSAEAGELVGIIGANGSGKTTLMKSICSLIKGGNNFIKLLARFISKCFISFVRNYNKTIIHLDY